MFFGAGNLIFPPQTGVAVGADWPLALAGLGLTGMLLPMLGVVAVGVDDDGLESLTRPIAAWCGAVLYFGTTMYFAIGKVHVIDHVGRFPTPALLVLLIAIVVWAAVDPLAVPAEGRALPPGFHHRLADRRRVHRPAVRGKSSSKTIRERGHTDPQGFKTAVIGVSAASFVGLFVVHGGLKYRGAPAAPCFLRTLTMPNC